MRKCVGFSLVEVLVVLSIASVFVVLALPSLSDFLSQSSAQVQREKMLRAIQLARSDAIALHDRVTLCASTDNKSCSGDWRDGYIETTDNRVLHVFQNLTSQHHELHWRSFPLNRPSLVFLSSGFPDSENGTFWYCVSSTLNPSWAIAVNQSGRARVIMPDAGGVIWDEKGKSLEC